VVKTDVEASAGITFEVVYEPTVVSPLPDATVDPTHEPYEPKPLPDVITFDILVFFLALEER
jgi:hypothetical protein